MIYLTDENVELLINRCPNLEDLELKNFTGFRNLSIISPKLKKVALGYISQSRKSCCKSVVIDCPNLLTMRFHDCDPDRIELNNAASVVEFAVDFSYLNVKDWCRIVRLLSKAPNVHKLKVANLWFKLLTLKNGLFPKTLKELRHLKYLELRTGYSRYDLVGMAALLEHCPNLESLVLSSISTIKEDGSLTEEVLNKPVEFKMPAVKQVKLSTYSGTIEEREFVKLLRAQGIAREKIVLGSL